MLDEDRSEDLDPTFPELGQEPPEPPEWEREQQRALDEADRVLEEHREGELAREECRREGG